ncbi:hypothetical protein D3C80_1543540 [compost metagenome]
MILAPSQIMKIAGINTRKKTESNRGILKLGSMNRKGGIFSSPKASANNTAAEPVTIANKASIAEPITATPTRITNALSPHLRMPPITSKKRFKKFFTPELFCTSLSLSLAAFLIEASVAASPFIAILSATVLASGTASHRIA